VFRTLGADWRPYTDSFLIHIYDQVRRAMAILGGRLGESVAGRSFYAGRIAHWMRRLLGNSSKDTGWRIADKARTEGYSARLFTPAVAAWQLDPRFAGEPAVLDLVNDFELYLWQGIPLVTHYHGTRHRGGRKPSDVSAWWNTQSTSVARACASIDVGTPTLPAAPQGTSSV
jgi:hypothetical protein